ncbi:hypothetical protein ABZ383_15870 [Streptomyces sp. NPDC005900]|uniref:hypothetical protein n=1 Tax=Streptomyces sp. NPDC005900 TaxID=3154569 RepID=UPI0033EDAA7C
MGVAQSVFLVQQCRFLGLRLCSAVAFGGFAAEVDFLDDFGELVFQRPAVEVGPFGSAVRGAASEDESQSVGGGVVTGPAATASSP